MASLFGETPQQIRSRTANNLAAGSSMFQNPSAAMIGAGLTGMAGGLFGSRNPEIARAEKLQKLQQDWAQTWDVNSITPETMPKVAQEMARGLMGIGEQQMAFQLMSQAQAFQPAVDTETAKTQQAKADKLRASVNKFSGDMRTIESAYKKIQRVAKEGTATGDMSMVFSIMKLNDPGSTVREGEYATAKNAGGVSDRLRNLYNNAIDGQLLTPGQRSSFLATAENLYKGEREATDLSISQVLQQADQDDVPREKVLGTKRLKAFQKRQSSKPKSKGLTPAEQRELEQLEKEFGSS